MKTIIGNKKLYLAMSIVLVVALAIGFWQFHDTVSVKASGIVSIDVIQGITPSAVGSESTYQDPVLTSAGGNIYQVTYTNGKIVIGDMSTGNYQPSFNISKWNDEVSLKLTPQFITGSAAPLANLSSKSLTSTTTAVDLKCQTTNLKSDFNEYGGLDIIVTLKSAPQGPLSFAYNPTNVTAYLQPALSKQYVDGDSDEFLTNIKVTDTTVTDTKTGRVLINRPDYVVNSVAFYANSKANQVLGGTNYKTGKVGHLYRMKATDSASKSAWLDWSMPDPSTLTLTDTTGFLKTAAYPVTVAPVGDTFGYTTAGGSSYGVDTDGYVGSLFTGAAGTITKMSIYCRNYQTSDVPQIKGVIVTHSNLNIITNGVTNATNTSLNSASQWYDCTFATNPTMTAQDYVLGVIPYYYHNFKYDTGSSNQSHYDSTNSFTTPQNLGTATHDTMKLSIYATYTPSGGVNVSNTPSSYTTSPVAPNTTPSTGLNYFTLTNNSTSSVTVTIGGTDLTGGTTWTLSDSATPGSTTYGMKAGLNNGSYNIVIKKTAPYNQLVSGLGSNSSQLWGFQLLSPTGSTDTVQKAGTITLTATTP